MKTLLLALLTLNPLAHAAEATQLLEVRRNSGFVHPDYAFSSLCEVGSEHSLRRTTFGKEPQEIDYKPTTYTAALPNAAAVIKALRQAARGVLIEEQGPVDGPTDVYTGILEGKTVDQRVKLLQRATSGQNYRNKSPVVPALVELAELNCRIPPR